MTPDEFKRRAREIHGQTYTYPDVSSIAKVTDHVRIICPEHGEFLQRVSVHINDECGCPDLSHRKHPWTRTTESFVAKAKLIHSERGYDYSYVDYVNSHTPVTVVCPEHGAFQIRPYAHLDPKMKQGCRQCGYANRKSLAKSTEQFVAEAKAKWGDRYDYADTVYVNKATKLTYRCQKHGVVEQNPVQHIKNGCQFCSGRGVGRHTTQTFAARGGEVHGEGRYDYGKVTLTSVTDYVTIACPKHGDFVQSARNHINSPNGCPACAAESSTSRAQQEIATFLRSHYTGDILLSDRKALGGKEIDVWLPDLGLGVEYHGHYWHLESRVGTRYHLDKANLAEDRGIVLLQVFEHEWRDRRAVVESRLLSQLGVNRRIYARNTEVETLDPLTKNVFLEMAHLQGEDRSKVHLGLRHAGELVACMTFGTPRFDRTFDHELMRYASEVGVNVVGGAGKLLAAFRRQWGGSIVSYADRRWSSGNLYRRLGFSEIGKTTPGYFYYHPGTKEVANRMKYQKHRLKMMPHYDDKLTEYDIMKLNGYDRIWDAGNTKWTLDYS